MAQPIKLDEVRAAALARIDRSERNFKLAFYRSVRSGEFVHRQLLLVG